MLIHLLKSCTKAEHKKIKLFLASHFDGKEETAEWILKLMHKYKSIEYCRSIAKYMAGAALKSFTQYFQNYQSQKTKNLLRT